jgi:hypothetical protein
MTHDDGPDGGDEIPRQSFWSAIPKRTLSRVVLLLGLLAGIVYLQQRTASIAGCMSRAFEAPVAPPEGARLRGPRVIPPASTSASP